MSEENSNMEMFAAGSNTVDDARGKLSEDAASLGPMHAGSIVIGLVDEIVGEGGVEVTGCVATQYEWIQIVKHWVAEMIDLDFDYFLYGSTGSTEWRLREYAERRLNTIAKSIGEEEVKRAFKQAEQEFAKGVDQLAWKAFRGTAEERDAFQAEIAREMSGTESPEVITKITELMNALGLDHPVAEQGKAARFAILLSPAAVVSDPACIIVPVIHYINADANDGRYRKNDDGTVPPIEWELRHIALSRLELKHIQRLPGAGQTVHDIDVVMLCPNSDSGREFSRASSSAHVGRQLDLFDDRCHVHLSCQVFRGTLEHSREKRRHFPRILVKFRAKRLPQQLLLGPNPDPVPNQENHQGHRQRPPSRKNQPCSDNRSKHP